MARPLSPRRRRAAAVSSLQESIEQQYSALPLEELWNTCVVDASKTHDNVRQYVCHNWDFWQQRLEREFADDRRWARIHARDYSEHELGERYAAGLMKEEHDKMVLIINLMDALGFAELFAQFVAARDEETRGSRDPYPYYWYPTVMRQLIYSSKPVGKKEYRAVHVLVALLKPTSDFDLTYVIFSPAEPWSEEELFLLQPFITDDFLKSRISVNRVSQPAYRVLLKTAGSWDSAILALRFARFAWDVGYNLDENK